MSLIDEIKSACNIVDVIGSQVTLKKAGSNYKGLCPFHNEKTPSFMVSEDKQIFTCFGCGATGDVIEFTQKYHNLDFQEALEKLAKDYGIEIRDRSYGSESKKEELYELNREAAIFFYRNFNKEANPAVEYMKKRGINSETLRKFGIGYSPDSWQELYDYLKSKGFEEEKMLKLGLISQSGDRYFDRFRNRIIFPIMNTRGKVIGFGGRALGDDSPKYLNSKESIIFLKKNNLFGLYLTRQDINIEGYAILVEGYMDVLSLYQHGVRNVAASLGTALTENQAKMLKRYTGKVLIAYDSDEAGTGAAMRATDVLYEAGCKIKVLEMPQGQDPDDFIREKGKDEFLKLAKTALPFVDYKLKHIRKSINTDTTEGSVSFLKEAAGVLRKLKPIEAEAYIKKIAAEYGISQGALKIEVFGSEGTLTKGRTAADSEIRKSEKQENCSLLEQNLIGLMLFKSSYVTELVPHESSFETPECHRIYENIKSMYKKDEEINLYQLKDSLDAEALKVLEFIVDTVHIAHRDREVFEECIAHIEGAALKKREEDLIKLLAILDDNKDKTQIEQLSRELLEVQKKKHGGNRDDL